MVHVVNKLESANCVTHNGTMHADEVFATAFLDLYLGDVFVFRTSSISENDVAPSVFVYDVGRGKFDHHQLDALKRENGIPYSSIGLLWKEFGKDYLRKENISNLEEVFIGIDKDLIEAIDGDDNGVFPKIECNYKVKTLSNVIKIFNPSLYSDETEAGQFVNAVEIAKMIFQEELLYIQGKVISDLKVTEIIKKKDKKTKYLLLDEYLPYEDALLNCEEGNQILFVAFPSNRGGYAIKTVPKSVEDRTARMDFPEEWAGLSDK